jgi:hypothetical protein
MTLQMKIDGQRNFGVSHRKVEPGYRGPTREETA